MKVRKEEMERGEKRSTESDPPLLSMLTRRSEDDYRPFIVDFLSREYTYINRTPGNQDMGGGGGGGGARGGGGESEWIVQMSTLPFQIGEPRYLFDEREWSEESPSSETGGNVRRLREKTMAYVWGELCEVERLWVLESLHD